MKNTLVNFFIKNYKFFYHTAGIVVLFAIFWLIFLRTVPNKELLVWIALLLPFSCYANIRSIKESGIESLFEEEKVNRGL